MNPVGSGSKGDIRTAVDQYSTAGVSDQREDFLCESAESQIAEVLLSNLNEIEPPSRKLAYPIFESARGKQAPVCNAIIKRPFSGKSGSSIPF